MGQLTSEQRHGLYQNEAERAGIHKPILSALYQVHNQPSLPDGETGLGISPAHRTKLEQIDSFVKQVQVAASTIRSLTSTLTVEGWKGADLWDSGKGCYTDKFVQAIAAGYTTPSSDLTAALLEASEPTVLLQAYLNEVVSDLQAANAPLDLNYLDQVLLSLVQQIPRYYTALPHQREAVLELIRIWRKLDTREAAISSLRSNPSASADLTALNETALDLTLLQAVSRISSGFGGYPHQREALLYFIQRWQQLTSREATIANLSQITSLEPNPELLDAALIALIERIPQQYQGKGEQRNALVEGFRLWQRLGNRSDALLALGVNPEIFTAAAPSQVEIVNAAVQLDRSLLEFVRQIPIQYQQPQYQQQHQREALIYLAQLWRGFATQDQTIQSLLYDLRQMQAARRDTPEAPPVPVSLILLDRPTQWPPTNLQLYAAIVPNGSFTWAEATRGGIYLPPNQLAVDAIVQMAQRVQEICDRLGRPISITNWYHPTANTESNGVLMSRHSYGDAITFYCNGLTSNQIYWFLDPWWNGGLGRYTQFPCLNYVDAQYYRTRWLR